MDIDKKVKHDPEINLEADTPLPANPLALVEDLKSESILNACRKGDAEALRTLAVSEGGLISDGVRRQAWPILLGHGTGDEVDGEGEEEILKEPSWRSLPRHRDEDQVRLDVDRSFIYYPNNQSQKQLEMRKEELSDLITEVLRRHPYLCYFQGYHDICQVLLLVLEPPDRARAVARLSCLRIRDFMLPTLAPALSQLRLIPDILYAVNPELCNHLSLRDQRSQPFFALSGTLTMYAHDIQEYGDIARLFDALLAREAVFSVYMFTQIVLQRADELFSTPADEQDILHSILSKLPKPLDLETLIANTAELFEKHPPESLRAWRAISSSSVLKTAGSPEQAALQTLEDGEVFFHKQVQELQRAEQREKVFKTMWKYRRPAGTVGIAILVGLLSIYMRKSPGTVGFVTALFRRSNFRG